MLSHATIANDEIFLFVPGNAQRETLYAKFFLRALKGD